MVATVGIPQGGPSLRLCYMVVQVRKRRRNPYERPMLCYTAPYEYVTWEIEQVLRTIHQRHHRKARTTCQ